MNYEESFAPLRITTDRSMYQMRTELETNERTHPSRSCEWLCCWTAYAEFFHARSRSRMTDLQWLSQPWSSEPSIGSPEGWSWLNRSKPEKSKRQKFALHHEKIMNHWSMSLPLSLSLVWADNSSDLDRLVTIAAPLDTFATLIANVYHSQ